VAIRCSECIYSMRGGLGHHILIIPASSPLPPMRGAAVDHALTILQNDWFYTRISNFVQSQITSTTRTPCPYHYCSLVKCFSFYISSYLYSLSVHTHPYLSILIYLPFLYAPIRTFPYTCVLETAFLSLLLETSHVPIFLIMGIYVLLLPCHSASMDKFKKGEKCIYISMYV